MEAGVRRSERGRVVFFISSSPVFFVPRHFPFSSPSSAASIDRTKHNVLLVPGGALSQSVQQPTLRLDNDRCCCRCGRKRRSDDDDDEEAAEEPSRRRRRRCCVGRFDLDLFLEL